MTTTPERPRLAQRYDHPTARERMASGRCPECGEHDFAHSSDPRFWIPRRCDLLPAGVTERIGQYDAEVAAGWSPEPVAGGH